ncbi:MAG: DUF2252 family protein [Bacillota bacterium]
MRTLLNQFLLISITAACFGTSLPATADSLPLKDPAYSFDQTKLNAAADSFHFLRSYVDYFYLLTQMNLASLPTVQSLENVPGWCVGDAHPENFGMLIQQDGRSIFTMNDMDDSGPCPVGLDLIRLMVSARLYNPDTKIDKILSAYLQGVQGQGRDIPSAIADMADKSRKKGITPSPKKVSGNKIIRNDNMTEVSADEMAQIKSALQIFRNVLSPSTKVLDVVATSKIGGGSGGLLRYEILLDNGGTQLHLEMKEEVTPSIAPVATAAIPNTAERIATTIRMDQTANPSVFYAVVNINGRDMMIRPRFDGNVGVDLTKQSDSDNQDIIRFEATVLGMIHSRSVTNVSAWVQQLQDLKQKNLESDISLIVDHFNAKYQSLK